MSTSTFEQGLADAIATSKAIRGARVDQITTSVHAANPGMSWDDPRASLQGALRHAGFQAFARTMRGERLTWHHRN